MPPTIRARQHAFLLLVSGYLSALLLPCSSAALLILVLPPPSSSTIFPLPVPTTILPSRLLHLCLSCRPFPHPPISLPALVSRAVLPRSRSPPRARLLYCAPLSRCWYQVRSAGCLRPISSCTATVRAPLSMPRSSLLASGLILDPLPRGKLTTNANCRCPSSDSQSHQCRLLTRACWLQSARALAGYRRRLRGQSVLLERCNCAP